MRKIVFLSSLLLASLACMPTLAQDNSSPQPASNAPEPPIHFYRVNLVVQEVDSNGKPTNSRTYATTVSTDKFRSGTIRAGSKVPIPSDRNGNFTYIDIGNNFDMRDVREFNRNLSINVKAEISSYTPSENAASQIVIRHNQWEAPVLIPIGKPTVIFSSDSLESKGAIQVIATVTPIP